jgi:hypothetical protein
MHLGRFVCHRPQLHTRCQRIVALVFFGVECMFACFEKFFFVFLWVFLLSKMIFFLGDEARGYFYDVS